MTPIQVLPMTPAPAPTAAGVVASRPSTGAAFDDVLDAARRMLDSDTSDANEDTADDREGEAPAVVSTPVGDDRLPARPDASATLAEVGVATDADVPAEQTNADLPVTSDESTKHLHPTASDPQISDTDAEPAESETATPDAGPVGSTAVPAAMTTSAPIGDIADAAPEVDPTTVTGDEPTVPQPDGVSIDLGVATDTATIDVDGREGAAEPTSTMTSPGDSAPITAPTVDTGTAPAIPITVEAATTEPGTTEVAERPTDRVDPADLGAAPDAGDGTARDAGTTTADALTETDRSPLDDADPARPTGSRADATEGETAPATDASPDSAEPAPTVARTTIPTTEPASGQPRTVDRVTTGEGPAAAPTPSPVEAVAEQLADALRPAMTALRTRGDGTQDLRLEVRTAEGTIGVELRRDGDEIRVVLSGESGEAMSRLGAERDRLAADLRRAGLHLGGLDVTTDDRSETPFDDDRSPSTSAVGDDHHHDGTAAVAFAAPTPRRASGLDVDL